jgi:hypothetical protein
VHGETSFRPVKLNSVQLQEEHGRLRWHRLDVKSVPYFV